MGHTSYSTCMHMYETGEARLPLLETKGLRCLFVCLFVFASCISHVIYETGRCFCNLKSMAQVVLYLVTALHCGTLGKGWNQVSICILAAQSQFNVFYYPFTAKGEFSVPKISADTPNSVPRCSWGQNLRSTTCKKYV